MTNALSRRGFLATPPAALETGVAAQTADTTKIENDISLSISTNVYSFHTLDWRPYFDNLNGDAVLVNIQSRALHFWNKDDSIYYRIHGTHDARETGRRSSDGCIRLKSKHIAKIFEMTGVGRKCCSFDDILLKLWQSINIQLCLEGDFMVWQEQRKVLGAHSLRLEKFAMGNKLEN